MKKKLLFLKATLLTMVLVFGAGFASMAATFTATTSGNWSSATTWGATGPGFNITDADIVTVPVGVNVTLDADLIINNASAGLSIAGTLTGATTSLALTAGTLSGTLTGTVTLSSLTVGATGWITSLGPINVGTFANSQATLALGAVVTVTNTLALNAGGLQLNTGGAIDLANNATLNMAGGSYSIVGGGLLTLAGTFNLLYSGSATAIGLETALAGLQNVTINLLSASSQLELSSNLSVLGTLSIQQGVLNLNGNSLTINGGINTASAGSILGSATSNIIVNGTGSVGTISMASSGQMINNLTIGITGGGNVALASDISVAGALSVNAGSLNLNGNNLTVGGTISEIGTGTIIGGSSSAITINGTGAIGTLLLSTQGNTLSNLTVNIASAGTVLLGSAITVSGTLALNGGSLDLNGQNLTIGGAITPSGTGSISGNILSNITFSGTGNAGTLLFTTGSQVINNLTANIGGSGMVSLGSNATIGGTLTLAQGNISIGNYNLTIPATGTVQGGSAASYVITNALTADTGSLIMTIATATSAMYQVGTLANYAPVNITNNAALSGVFGAMAHPGVFASGTTGANLANTTSVVNTSWDITSSLATGNNVNLEMFWNTAMQANGFDNTQAYVSHYTNGAWNTSALTAATAVSGGFSLALTGVTSFSPFAVFDKNTTTAIQYVKPAASFSIYPNPAADQINVTVLGADNFSVLKIYDAIGNEILSQRVVNALAVIDISNLTSGVYFASLNGGMTKKFIKE